MIIQEKYVDAAGVLHEHLIRTYSTDGKKIRQIETGVIYDEAVDVKPCRYTYEETDEDIERVEE